MVFFTSDEDLDEAQPLYGERLTQFLYGERVEVCKHEDCSNFACNRCGKDFS